MCGFSGVRFSVSAPTLRALELAFCVSKFNLYFYVLGDVGQFSHTLNGLVMGGHEKGDLMQS